MSLFEKSSVSLSPGETVIKLGRCNGKVPRGEDLGVKLSLPSRMVRKIKWVKVKGEMVLTNNRLIIVGERGRLRKKVMPFLDLDLRCLKAVSTSKQLIGKQKLSLSIDIGTGKLESMELKLEDASSWTAAIRGQKRQTPQQIMAMFKKNKEGYERGDLEGKAFVNLLEYFNFRDDDGRYWTIGVRSEEWYCHDGMSWVKGTPPPALFKVTSPTTPAFTMAPTKEKCPQCDFENEATSKFCETCGQRLT